MLACVIKRNITLYIKAVMLCVIILMLERLADHWIMRSCLYILLFVMVNNFCETDYFARKFAEQIFCIYKNLKKKRFTAMQPSNLRQNVRVQLYKKRSIAENMRDVSVPNVRAALRHETPLFYYYCSCRDCTYVGKPESCAQNKCYLCSPSFVKPSIPQMRRGGANVRD